MSDLGILPEERLLWQFPVMCLLVTFPTSLCEAYLLTFSKKRKEVQSIASEMAVERRWLQPCTLSLADLLWRKSCGVLGTVLQKDPHSKYPTDLVKNGILSTARWVNVQTHTFFIKPQIRPQPHLKPWQRCLGQPWARGWVSGLQRLFGNKHVLFEVTAFGVICYMVIDS